MSSPVSLQRTTSGLARATTRVERATTRVAPTAQHRFVVHPVVRIPFASIRNGRMIALLFAADPRERYPMKHHLHPLTLVTRGD